VEQTFDTVAPVFATDCADLVATSFDIPNGIIDQDIATPGIPTLRVSDLQLRDEFTVSGPAAGTPIELRLRVHAAGYVSAGAGDAQFAMLTLALEPFPLMVGDQLPQRTWGSVDVEVAFDDSLDLVLHRTAGEPIGILIRAQLSVGNYCWGDTHLAFRFVDLPPGCSVTSCKGYRQDPQVGAESMSWGRVKAAYR